MSSLSKKVVGKPALEEEATEAYPHLPGLHHSKHSSVGSLRSLSIREDEETVPDVLEEHEEFDEELEEFDKDGDIEIAGEVADQFDTERSFPETSSRPPRSLPKPSGVSPPASVMAKFSALPLMDYFDSQKQVPIGDSGNIFNVYLAGKEGPVIFCLHGGGYSGATFALAAKTMKDKVRVVAMDARGHGETVTSHDSDLSIETMCKDTLSVIWSLFGSTDTPAIILLGHSMGGAVAVNLAASGVLPTLAGLIVVDVVEGTAMASLAHMQAILAARPSSFSSLERAIEWSLRGGILRNVDSSRLSVPSTVRLDASNRYTWRTKLEDSEPYWRSWYEGLDDTFLQCHVPKLLLLAGTDRLDKKLTIAQMQGKFQMLVIRHSGHAIQEDEPEEFASSVLGFVSRNRIGSHGAMIPTFVRR